MGLTFTVGNAQHVFVEPYGSNLDRALHGHFPGQIRVMDDEEPWYSQELGWSGWEELQTRAAALLGRSAVTHLLSMPAWKGVYLPVEIEPCSLTDIPGDTTPLEVAALDHLMSELERFGTAAGLPIDDAALEALAGKYMEDDDLIDHDMDIQTYAQLLLAAHFAVKNRYALWVVK